MNAEESKDSAIKAANAMPNKTVGAVTVEDPSARRLETSPEIPGDTVHSAVPGEKQE